MNAAADRLEDGFPHGTVDGYRDGCRGNICPAAADHGLSCKKASQLAAGDYRYQKLVKQGLTPAEIAFELGLNPDPSAAPRTTPSTAPAPAPVDEPTEVLDEQPDDVEALVEAAAPAEVPAEGEGMGHPSIEPMPRLSLADFTVGMSIAAGHKKGREIREWCRSNGFPGMPAKGVIPHPALAAYAAAHPITSTEAEPAPVDDETLGGGRPSEVGPPASEQESHGEPAAELDREVLNHFIGTEIVEGTVEEVAAGLLQSQRSDMLDETRARIDEPPHPEWGEVAAAADVEKAREIAARLFLELTDTETQRDQAHAALELALRKWDEAASRVAMLELRLSVSRAIVENHRAGLDVAEQRVLALSQDATYQKGLADQWRDFAHERSEAADRHETQLREVTRDRDRLQSLIEDAAIATPRRRRRLRRAAT